MNLDPIDARARVAPQATALCFEGREYRYADLDRRARQLAQRLHERGLRRGDRVGILALNQVAHFDLLLAAPKLGFVYVPFNHRLTLAELRVLAAGVGPSLLFVDAEREPLAASLGLPRLPLLAYEDWLAQAGDEPGTAPPGLTPEDLHMILFTGGSTGTPKGAALPYRQTLGNAADTVAVWGISHDDCAIQCTPCFHAAANVLSLPLLLAGGKVLLMPRFDAASYLALAKAHAVSLMFMVPTMFLALANEPAFERAAWPRLRWAISGGAPCPPPLHARYAEAGIALRQGYGLTEAGVNCFFHSDADEAAQQPDSVGRPMPNLQVALCDADGRRVGDGEVGEITLAGPQVCAGYYGADDSGGDSLLRDGWLWTGDLASRDRDGLYTICGRRKELYISGGENVHPAEVEAALAQCAGVAECAVFGWPHPRWGECGVAVVVMQPGSTNADAERLRAELRTRLAGYKLPNDFLFVAELPRSAAGKILKSAARALYAAARADLGVAA